MWTKECNEKYIVLLYHRQTPWANVTVPLTVHICIFLVSCGRRALLNKEQDISINIFYVHHTCLAHTFLWCSVTQDNHWIVPCLATIKQNLFSLNKIALKSLWYRPRRLCGMNHKHLRYLPPKLVAPSLWFDFYVVRGWKGRRCSGLYLPTKFLWSSLPLDRLREHRWGEWYIWRLST